MFEDNVAMFFTSYYCIEEAMQQYHIIPVDIDIAKKTLHNFIEALIDIVTDTSQTSKDYGEDAFCLNLYRYFRHVSLKDFLENDENGFKTFINDCLSTGDLIDPYLIRHVGDRCLCLRELFIGL